jgi:hypothetical protein
LAGGRVIVPGEASSPIKARRTSVRISATVRDENGQGWADIIDLLTMYPDARRGVARILGEIDAARA